MYNVINITSKK